jgi:hypothetical protein
VRVPGSPSPLRRGRRALSYGRKWLPRLPADVWWSRHYELDGGHRRVFHVHVAKTGGTSLSRSFLGVGGEDVDEVHHRMMATEPRATRSGPYVLVAHDPRALRRGWYFFGWSNHPIWYVAPPDDTFTVTVLRDPMARVLSLYRYLSDPRADDGLPRSAGRWRRMTRGGFAAFLDRIPPNNLHGQLNLFSRAHDPHEAATRIRQLSAYFFTESYDLGVQALADRLHLPLTVRRDRVSAAESEPAPEQLTRLRQMLEPEYRLLDLLREDPGNRIGPVPHPPEEVGARTESRASHW